LNPQPPLLESGALPIELLACMGTEALSIITEQEPLLPNNLFCFPMNRVFSAVIAEFLQFHTGRIIPAVLFAGVIALFTFGASESYYRTNIFFL
jgi:hypothetical protein